MPIGRKKKSPNLGSQSLTAGTTPPKKGHSSAAMTCAESTLDAWRIPPTLNSVVEMASCHHLCL